MHPIPINATAMSDSEMDEDLKRAIALSLEQPSSPTIRERKLIDLTISDDDDDLDAPVTHVSRSHNLIPFLIQVWMSNRTPIYKCPASQATHYLMA